jgi:penicillin-binding protein 1A
VATQGRRSPGSAFKPLILATALQRGVALDREFPGGTCAVLEDVPGWDEEGACNYGDTAHGPLTLREATVRSANTVYARLADELGPDVLLAGVAGARDHRTPR